MGIATHSAIRHCVIGQTVDKNDANMSVAERSPKS